MNHQVRTSRKGLAFLEAHEGVVLKAYRCPAGRWTIGPGLTAASGVVTPRAGMTITRDHATRLLRKALCRNYEPAVAKTLGSVSQHAFDGAVSFHYNTGAIGRASWVESFLAGVRSEVRRRLALWNKGGGRVLPGLVRRRREEADVILDDVWPRGLDVASAEAASDLDHARFVVSVTDLEIQSIREGFATTGFAPGKTPGKISRPAVEAFQRRYDLTVDGLIGRATLSMLQRELDARRKIKQGCSVSAGGGVAVGANEAAGAPTAPDVDIDVVGSALVTWAGIAVLAVGLCILAWAAWHYRDMVAARIQSFAPRIARWLRSF